MIFLVILLAFRDSLVVTLDPVLETCILMIRMSRKSPGMSRRVRSEGATGRIDMDMLASSLRVKG